MKLSVALACLLALVGMITSQQCLPFSMQGSSSLYAAYGNNVYKYSLPDLNIELQRTFNFNICPPGSIDNETFVLSTNTNNYQSTVLSSSDLSVVSQSSNAAPSGDYPYFIKYGSGCAVKDNNKYCFFYDSSSQQSSLQHISNGYPIEILRLPKNDSIAAYIGFDSQVDGRLHLATQTCTKSGCSIMTYYKLSLNPLVVSSGPVQLSNTENHNCVTQPLKCQVSVLLDMHAQNDMVSFTWTKSDGQNPTITLQNYDARCNLMYTTIYGDNSNAVPGRCTEAVFAVSTTQPPNQSGDTNTGADAQRSSGARLSSNSMLLAVVIMSVVLLL